MKKIILTNKFFQKLHDLIKNKFYSIDGVLKNMSTNQIYGFGTYDEEKPNLRTEFIKAYNSLSNIKINGKYFYDRVKELEKGNSHILLSRIYADIFFTYIGCFSYEDFKERYFFDFEEIEIEKQRMVMEENNKDRISDFSTNYDGYYYSYKYHIVKKFRLKIDYDIKPYSYPENKYKAVQQGLQDRDPNNPEDKGDIYTGYAEEVEGYLYIYLTNKKLKTRLQFMSALSKAKAKNKPLMLASYQAVSTNNYVINGEALLIRESNKNMNEEEMDTINRYFFLQRKNFRILEKNLFSVHDLRVKRVVKLDKIKHMVGTYRIWNFDRNKNIIQSVFRIHKDYTSDIHTILELKQQLCLLNIYGDYTESLYVSSHPKEGVGIKNYAIVNIPPFSFKEEHKYIMGVFCTIGFGRNRGPYGGDIVMLWESEETNTKSDIEIREVKKEDIETFISENESLIGLYKKLKEGGL